MDYVIVIPTYNPEEVLVEMVDKIIEMLPKVELILIDDGSEERCKRCLKRNSLIYFREKWMGDCMRLLMLKDK